MAIENEHQRRVTLAAIDTLTDDIQRLDTGTYNLEDWAIKAIRAGIVSQVADLSKQLADYDRDYYVSA